METDSASKGHQPKQLPRSDFAEWAYNAATLYLSKRANEKNSDGEDETLSPPLLASPSLVAISTKSLSGGGGTGGVSLNTVSKAVARLEAEPYDASLIDESERLVVTGLTESMLQPNKRSDDAAYTDAESAHSAIAALGAIVPRVRVCQRPFRKNDIVWSCRTCQSNATCVVCNDCYVSSDHEGHDVHFMQAVEGGCCDCGDPDAWDPAGFCNKHGSGATLDEGTLGRLMGEGVLESARGVLEATAEWLVQVAGEVAKSFSCVKGTTDEINKKIGDELPQSPSMYLVLHSDSIHTGPDICAGLRELYSALVPPPAEGMLERIVQLLESSGDIVVWGTTEITRQSLLKKASLLDTKHGLVVSIKTVEDLITERRALAVLRWLGTVARACDPLCDAVAKALMDEGRLNPILGAGLKMCKPVAEAWNALLLTLLAVPSFKAGLADAYCDMHRALQLEYARGMGVAERSPFSLSVQFLNRERYAKYLVQQQNVERTLGFSLLGALEVAIQSSGVKTSLPTLDPDHPVLVHQRYNPAIADLTYLVNVRGMARVVVASRSNPSSNPGSSFLDAWMKCLSLGQNMDNIVWRTWGQQHVESDPTGYYGAFSFSIGLGALFAQLLNWDDEDSGLTNAGSSKDSFNIEPPPPLMTRVEMTCHVITTGLWEWLESAMQSYCATPGDGLNVSQHSRCPAALPMSTVASMHGTPLAIRALPVAQVHPFSFHLPLHRFAAACLCEVMRQPVASSMDNLLTRLHNAGNKAQVKKMVCGVMEFPVIVLSRAAQIRSGLWKRNGPVMDQEAQLYASAPCCVNFRDADLILLQVFLLWNHSFDGAQGNDSTGSFAKDVGCAHLVNLLLHRFGLFDFLGFAKAPDTDVSSYCNEVNDGLYPAEQDSRTGILLPYSYTPARDTSSFLSLLDELLHLLLILITELPPPPPQDKNEKARQAKSKLRRELVHQLASGPKTHSELEQVYQVIARADCVVLSAEGGVLNPDNPAGAVIDEALFHIAVEKSSSARGGGDLWELKRDAWAEYDPAFFHLSIEGHQCAAENRPAVKSSPASARELPPQPYTPRPSSAHPSFLRIRRDITSDASVLAIAYRTLHIHCHSGDPRRSMKNLRGTSAYENMATRETVLARVVHLLTLGAYAWDNVHAFGENELTKGSWKNRGGGGRGSIFYNFEEVPTRSDFVQMALLSNPREVMACDWYEGEETAIELLQRLAVKNEGGNGFVIQDSSLRSGAAWICDYATKCHPEAAKILDVNSCAGKQSAENGVAGESDKQRKMREAKEKALAKIKAQTEKFNAAFLGEDNDSVGTNKPNAAKTTGADLATTATVESDVQRRKREAKEKALANINAQAKLFTEALLREEGSGTAGVEPTAVDKEATERRNKISETSLDERPPCIICSQSLEKGDVAASFCAHAQASTVQKGGGGLPPDSSADSSCSFRRFVGTHVSLCGHAVHSSCLESDLDRTSAENDDLLSREFRCPLCRRLSNCLVPYAAYDWASGDDQEKHPCNLSDVPTIHNFLSHTSWLGCHSNAEIVWDGRCEFVDRTNSSGLGSYIGDTRVRGITTLPLDSNSDRTKKILDWQRLIQQLSEISLKADVKRLGVERLRGDCGEFRRCLLESGINAENHKDEQEDYLRELSSIFHTIQCFTYSCCSDGRQARRLAKQCSISPNTDITKQLHSKYGVGSAICDGALLIFPPLTAGVRDNLFDGRLGKLRRLGFAIAARAGSFSREIVQLALAFPVIRNQNSALDAKNRALGASVQTRSDLASVDRASVTYPLLNGHVLTHVVAAMVALCGKKQDHSYLTGTQENERSSPSTGDDNTLYVCLSFIKVGFLARVLQVMLGCLGLHANMPCQNTEQQILNALDAVEQLSGKKENSHNEDATWRRGCYLLLKCALSPCNGKSDGASREDVESMPTLFEDACLAAAEQSVSFLADVGLILQILVPDASINLKQPHEATNDSKLASLMNCLCIEPVLLMLESPLVREVLSSWYAMSSLFHARSMEVGNPSSLIQGRNPYPTLDWPIVEQSGAFPESSLTLKQVTSVPLIGGKRSYLGSSLKERQACVQMLPTSFTSLYAQASGLCPDFDQTALCLVCGELLDASGKGECTKHSYKCGGGAGIFFLLQERSALTIHGTKAAYEPSPYVDSHGEAPKHGGRPLFLDYNRYDDLRVLWFGHLVREKVIFERGNLGEGLIIDNFY